MSKDLDWQKYGNCNGVDTEEFFTQDDSNMYANAGLLTRICGNCDVQKACLDYALRNKVSGWWGNTTEYKRTVMRKELGIIAVPVVPHWEFQ
jgi:hypothetical protein